MLIAVVDDEAAVRSRLLTLMSQWFSKKDALSHIADVQYEEYGDGSQFLAAAQEKCFDLVLLDIYMIGKNGIETAALLRRLDPGCPVIFLTSSKDHMADAFAVHAFDYLVKPIDPERLFAALDDMRSVLPAFQPGLELNINGGRVSVLYSDIRCIMSDSQYCMVYCEDTYRCRVAFKELTNKLSGDLRFLVINRGILVNMSHVSSMDARICLMNNGMRFPINTRRSSQLRQALIDYRFRNRANQISRRDVR